MKMTGWQTRLTFPVVPKDQWELPSLPPESPEENQAEEKIRPDSENCSSASRKRMEKEVSDVPDESATRSRRRTRSKPRTKSATSDSTSSSSSKTPNVGPKSSNQHDARTATQVLNDNQNEDDELVYIKSEEAEQTMPTILPDPDDQNHFCRACNMQKISRIAYRNHLRRFHKMQLTPMQPPRSTAPKDQLPDLYDPYFYCRICKKKYNDSVAYRRHCTIRHDMVLVRKGTVPDTTITPDPDDPLNHCKACNRSYEVRATYRDHLRRVHKMALEPACNPANLDRSKGFVCRFCQETFQEGKVYGAHLQANHQGKLEKR